MLKGVRYCITHHESGVVQMIDAWTFIHEIENSDGEYDYNLSVYDEAYEILRKKLTFQIVPRKTANRTEWNPALKAYIREKKEGK